MLDNRLFRYSLQIPIEWFADMRTEGGTFKIADPAGTRLLADGTNLPGGVIVRFKAREVLPVDSGGAELFTEERLNHPNAVLGSIPAILWKEGAVENLYQVIRIAFIQHGVLFEAYAEIEADISLEEAANAEGRGDEDSSQHQPVLASDRDFLCTCIDKIMQVESSNG